MRRGEGPAPRRRWLLLLAVLAALCCAAAGSGGRRRAASLGEMLREVEALMEDTQHKLRNAVQEVSEARRGGRQFLSAPLAAAGLRAARRLLARHSACPDGAPGCSRSALCSSGTAFRRFRASLPCSSALARGLCSFPPALALCWRRALRVALREPPCRSVRESCRQVSERARQERGKGTGAEKCWCCAGAKAGEVIPSKD